MRQRIVVLGGGASGMIAAIAAAESAPSGAEVLLLERNARIGKKLLATGNGRCNLSNAVILPAFYFSSDQKRLAACLEHIDQADPMAWLTSHGLWCRMPDDAGRIYPYSNQAADVLNFLLDWIARTGVEVRTESSVQSFRQTRSGYLIQLESSPAIQADAVICALGGSAGPQFGTDGFGPELAKSCGLHMEPLYPCLVPLQCDKRQIQGLSGIRVRADVLLYDGDQFLHSESGEVQFTDYGLSGIAVMQLSGRLQPGKGPKHPEIRLNLFPEHTEESLSAALQQRSRQLSRATAADFMTGLLQHRVGMAVWRAQELGPKDRLVSSLSSAEWRKLAHGLISWRFTNLVPTGWAAAQTTGGGLSLREIEAENFQLRGCPGLYFVGETLDCAGSCGGYNLHWAFGTGLLAGRHAGRSLSRLSQNKRK